MSGITINDGAVIAGSSVVTKNVEAYSMVGGNPAKHLKYRFTSEIILLLQQFKWWDLPEQIIKEIVLLLCAEPSVTDLQNLIKLYR